MRFSDKSITSVTELLDELRKHGTSIQHPFWFRGQADSSWMLLPKYMRSNGLPPESHLMNRFKQYASIILPSAPSTDFDWLFLMQHHGMATRLLDWSESPLTALYFAVSEFGDSKLATVDGALWTLLPTELNKRSRYRPDFANEIPSFNDEHLKSYSPTTIASEQKSMLFPMAAIATRNSPRMQAQQGVFTISHRDKVEHQAVDAAPHNYVWRYIIPAASKPQILAELSILGINRFSLFPELESLSVHLSS